MGTGPTSPSDFYSKTTESCAYSLIPPSNHTEFCLFWSFWLEIYSHYLRKCIWKFEVSHIFEKSRWRTSSFFLVLHNHIPVKSLAFSFSEFFRRDYDVFSGDSPILEGIPVVMTSRSRKYVIISPKKLGKWECERFHWYVIVQCHLSRSILEISSIFYWKLAKATDFLLIPPSNHTEICW